MSIRHIPHGYAATLGTAIAREPRVGYSNVRNLNRIGRPMMCEDPFDLDFLEILKQLRMTREFQHYSLNSSSLHLTNMYANVNKVFVIIPKLLVVNYYIFWSSFIC
jgi:hypothetical protein